MQNALANLMPLFVDQNGCHCLSAALASLAAKDSQFIFDCACENALQISQGVPAGPAEFYAFLPTENNFFFFNFFSARTLRRRPLTVFAADFVRGQALEAEISPNFRLGALFFF